MMLPFELAEIMIYDFGSREIPYMSVLSKFQPSLPGNIGHQSLLEPPWIISPSPAMLAIEAMFSNCITF